MYVEGSDQYDYHRQTLRPPIQSRLQGPHPPLHRRPVGPRAPHGSLPEGRRQILLLHGRPPRRLRPLELQIPTPLERRRHRPPQRCRRPLGRRRPQTRPPLRRIRAPLQLLRLARPLPPRRHQGPLRQHSLRRPEPRLRRPLPRLLRHARRLRQDHQARPHGPHRPRLAGSSTTSTASKTSSTSTSPTSSTPTAASPSTEYGFATVAELYNVAPTSYNGKSEAIYFSKTPTDCPDGTSCVIDHERSVLNEIDPNPWQTDTCIGDWHYKLGANYKTPKKVIDLLVDIVSKNGNLLLNIPLPASGMPDPEELRILEAITQWTSINGEAIYSTRPWKIHGEGPSTKVVIKPNGKEFDPNEGKQPDLTYRGHPLHHQGQNPLRPRPWAGPPPNSSSTR